MILKYMAFVSISLLHSIFTVFYMDVFARQHLPRIDASGVISSGNSNRKFLFYFILGQLLYAFWSIAKSIMFRRFVNMCHFVVTYTRLWKLSRCGPTWAVSFMLLWLPSIAQCVHPAVCFTLLMAIYDALLVHCEAGVYTLSIGESRNNEHIHLACDVVGGVGAAMACCLYDLENVESGGSYVFCLFTTSCALITALILCAFGRQQNQNCKVNGGVDEGVVNTEDFLYFAQQTTKRCSMKAAIFFWALQGYSSVFATCFFNVFLAMCSNAPSTSVRSFLLFAAFVIPHGVVAVMALFYRGVGKRRIVSLLLMLRIVVGLFFIVVAMSSSYMSVPYMGTKVSFNFFVFLLFLNYVLTRTMGNFQESILCDLVDEDAVIFSRQNSTTKVMRQVLTMASKPCESMALVVTFPLLVVVGHNYSDGLEMNDGGGDGGGGGGGVAWLAGGTTLLTSLLMLWGWRRNYNLDGSHLQFVRMAARKRVDGEARIV